MANHFWYSAKQAALRGLREPDVWPYHRSDGSVSYIETPPTRAYAALDDGQVVEYTEWLTDEGRPGGDFDDFAYLGTGRYSHSVKV